VGTNPSKFPPFVWCQWAHGLLRYEEYIPPGGGTICEIHEDWGSLDRNESWYGLVILMEASGDQSVEVSTLFLVSMGPGIVEI